MLLLSHSLVVIDNITRAIDAIPILRSLSLVFERFSSITSSLDWKIVSSIWWFVSFLLSLQGKPSLLMYFSYLIMVSISITPSLLFFIAKKSNQKRLVQLNASGYLNASASFKMAAFIYHCFWISGLSESVVKKRFIFASAFVVTLRCSNVILVS